MDDARRQAQLGIERLAALLRMRAWGEDGTPPLHPAQRALLLALAGRSGGLRGGELAAQLGVSAASVSDSLRALEAKGWLRRRPDPDDGRASRAVLTAAGAALVRRLQHPAAGLGPLLQALPEQDLGHLLRALQLMILEAQRLGLADGPRTCLGCEFFRPHASTDAAEPHWCDYVGAAFGDAALRVDCPEQRPRSREALDATVRRFREAAPS
ncbi:MarR family winged helix-turn-helix transcriptional regulator [Vulcaniibacterium tengchongense]|uniref:MarR family transcriptional regulator n=1 Tax=Vulcaniibacterium tengchongense TaxID=1273429 RepID=A0A3N4VA48_9GAMM|nr:MarR family transcriptional regulator [Vulcaniibacterium tengchongense]RPE79886.1 MarR family transcriptional regulator [Vulcaniibacterium tengchongense]